MFEKIVKSEILISFRLTLRKWDNIMYALIFECQEITIDDTVYSNSM